MNFWASRLGAPQPAAAQHPAFQPTAQPAVQQPAVQRPWWANDFAQQVTQQQPEPQAALPPEQNEGWGTVAGSLRKAKSSKSTETCVECGSGNIFRPEGQPNAMVQCYECGYNPRFSQTGGAGGLPSDAAGPAQPARQLATAGAGGVSQFSPQTIVGRI